MEREQLAEVNGGGFAYDLGRVIRFISFAINPVPGTAYAIVDWEVNALNNEYSE